jgi:hypothetical protein
MSILYIWCVPYYGKITDSWPESITGVTIFTVLLCSPSKSDGILKIFTKVGTIVFLLPVLPLKNVIIPAPDRDKDRRVHRYGR